MVVTSEDVLNLTAGRSYSAGGHNLHFSTRILKHVRILTPDTNSEARANSDIWHEFWSTRKFWHHFTSSCSFIFSLSLLRPLPKSGPLYIKENEVMKWRQKSTMVCTCLLSTEWTNFWGINKNKNKHCCTTSSKSKSSISSLSFRYLPCLMINKELVNTHLSTFEHSNLTRNDKNNSTWPHLKTESLTLALIQHHGCFEKQWTCLVFNEALGPRSI